MSEGLSESDRHQLGFGWWSFQGWGSLTLGTLICVGLFNQIGILAVILAIGNIGLSLMIIRLSRTALVVGTVLSVNPILWIINGIYIKNRWDDPRVLENRGGATSSDSRAAAAGDGAGLEQGAPFVPSAQLVPDVSPSQAQTQAAGRSEVQTPEDEELWAEAMCEAESANRRQGLWAKCFAEARGVDPAAKAAYMVVRVAEMRAELLAERQALEARHRANEEQQRLAMLDEAQRTYELLPKGTCPNCDALIPVVSAECPKCRALFGPGSAWKVTPLT